MAKKPASPRSVRCYHCGHRFDVSARAMTGSCPKCYAKLMLDDIVIKNTQSYRKLQTCGRLVVEARGRVIADLVEAEEGVQVVGKLEAKAYRGGPVTIGAKAIWKGDCEAPSLVIEFGAQVIGGYFVIPADESDEPSRAAQIEAQVDAEVEEEEDLTPPMKTSATRKVAKKTAKKVAKKAAVKAAAKPAPAQPKAAPTKAEGDEEGEKPQIKVARTRPLRK
jgi:cytoskeletal protein CcmA (bactofilin family)